jgi:hypothetical protein
MEMEGVMEAEVEHLGALQLEIKGRQPLCK